MQRRRWTHLAQHLYSAHNNAILARAQSAKSEAQCHTVLSDWLTFYRKGHIGLTLNTNGSEEAVRESLVHDLDLSAFKQYLKSQRDETLEGIWQFSSYTVALKKEGNVHKGYIVESTNPSWKAGQVKFIINDPALHFNQKFAYSPHGHRWSRHSARLFY
jgi:hypothetical protein|tara:strand:- start:42 stop:518 length:477 start_codon:yes stop_codon:yes gene_type:complete